MLRFLGLVIVLAVGAAYTTRPDETKAEANLKQQLLLVVARQDIGQSRGTAGNIALIGCKLRPNDCYDLVRSQIKTEFTDNLLFSRFSAQGFGKRTSCVGAFGVFLCPGGLKDTDQAPG